ncbi:MAG: hypothetical protein QOK23_2307 [Gammaproteobacteria bacterium]|jgi:hypothetical protein|nr:hypothetical protein [Gammaproteobacteria bacterium]
MKHRYRPRGVFKASEGPILSDNPKYLRVIRCKRGLIRWFFLRVDVNSVVAQYITHVVSSARYPAEFMGNGDVLSEAPVSKRP